MTVDKHVTCILQSHGTDAYVKHNYMDASRIHVFEKSVLPYAVNVNIPKVVPLKLTNFN
jgi:hydroxyacyl-ACP dehydratase HTD2-like protein with hotdog domain